LGKFGTTDRLLAGFAEICLKSRVEVSQKMSIFVSILGSLSTTFATSTPHRAIDRLV